MQYAILAGISSPRTGNLLGSRVAVAAVLAISQETHVPEIGRQDSKPGECIFRENILTYRRHVLAGKQAIRILRAFEAFIPGLPNHVTHASAAVIDARSRSTRKNCTSAVDVEERSQVW